MPQMLRNFIGPGPVQVDAQVINGAPLWWQWTYGAEAQGVNARAVLPGGTYGIVVITEAVPLAGHLQWSDTLLHAQRYYDLAVSANPKTRFYIYETWGSLGTTASDLRAWRDSLDSDRALWMTISDHLNTQRPDGAAAVMLVPAGAAMAALHDAIVAGRVPGVTSIRQMFSDDIHLNDSGSYYLSLVQYATLLRQSPEGLANLTFDEWGGAFASVTPALAAALQTLAWDSVRADPHSGLGGMATDGPDLLTGTEGHDLLAGLGGNDTLSGGAGDDTLDGGSGRDRLFGGAGDDRVSGGAGNDHLFGGKGQDTLRGGRGNDLLKGGDGHDILQGEAGDDRLFGDAGKDRLFGGDGNDTLNGGTGNDRLTGGAGADVFIFTRGSGRDRITDFTPAEGDRLHLGRDLAASGQSPGPIVTQYAQVVNGSLHLTFDTGDRLILDGVATTAGLSDWIVLI